MNEDWPRFLATAHGIAAIAFGTTQVLLPRYFARLFALPSGTSSVTAALVRALGIRDIVLGIGAWQSGRSSKCTPTVWVVLRLVSDTLDALGLAYFILRGQRAPRFVVLACLAAASSVYSAFVLLAGARDRP